MKRLVVIAVALLLAGAGEAPLFRFTRPLTGARGWSRLELPEEVINACRPGLADLRVLAPDGAEIPFAVEQSIGAVPAEWVVRDVESLEGRETTAIVDRGVHPALVARVQIVGAGDDFLKPVILEASDDRGAWREIARGSIFATDRARMSSLRFPPNDRRYWRLRLDDRFGPPVTPRAVMATPAADEGPGQREVTVAATRTSDEGGRSVYGVTLTNPAVSRLRIMPSEPAFARTVRVYEKVFFRDELARRLVGMGSIVRAPSQRESVDVLLGDVASRDLEIEIDDGGSPPLTFTQVTAVVEPRSLLFFAQVSGAAELVYGAPQVGPPRYDLTAALALGLPSHIEPVHMGPVSDRGAPPPAIATPPRGAAIDPAQWRRRTPLRLPSAGNLAYVALEALDGASDADVRIIDAESRQVPYVVERTIRHARTDAKPEVAQIGARTIAAIRDLASPRAIDGLELTATKPEYFTRAVSVVEATRDDRGVTGERILGTATWERRPGDPVLPLVIPLASPAQTAFEVRIENGDNAPIVLGHTTVLRASRRIDFLFSPGDRLVLLAGNPSATAPVYDLALLADAVLAAPAQAAILEAPSEASEPESKRPPKWFWACVIVAGLALAIALTRSMRGAPPE